MLIAIRNAWHPHCPLSAVPPGGGGAAARDAPAQSDDGSAEARAPTPGLLDELSSLLASARAVLSNFLELMSLEARRAGLALMWMVAGGFIAAICLAAAWLGLMVALAMWAVSLGVPPIVAVIAVALMNCVAGAVLIYLCIGMSRHLLFPATQRQVAGKSPVKRPVP
jgi:hypothetical protein